jgi:hypothetical protein
MSQPLFRPAGSRAEIAVRFALVLLAFSLFWAAREQRQEFRMDVSATGELALGSWFLVHLLGILAGFVFGVAGRPTLGGWTYRWSIAVALAAIPLVILIVVTLFYAGPLSQPPRFLFRPISLALNMLESVPLAALIGVALASGLVSREALDRGGGLGADVGEAGP